MKLLTNKQFQGVIDKVEEPLKKEIEELKDRIFDKEYFYLKRVDKLEKELYQYEEYIKEQEKCIEDYNNKTQKLINDKKLLFGAKGGITKQLHKIEKENANLKEYIKELEQKLSERYILKELAPQKAKNTQVMKTKSSAVTSKIIKKVVEDE